MQQHERLDKILLDMDKVGKSIWDGLSKIKEGVSRAVEYLDEKLKEIGNKTYEKLRETKNKISEYGPIVKNSALGSLPYLPKVLISSGLSMKNTYRGLWGRVGGYLLMGAGVVALVSFVLSGIHGLPSPNNENIQYVGSPDGYQGFVPKGVINYEGHTNPKGDLILDDGRILNNAVWHGKYSDTIIQSHNLMVKLNSRLNGDMQDFYIIKGQVPVKQITINGQTYYVIDANKINEANIAGFYTYDKWVPNFVAAINTPGTYAAELPGNSPVFEWQNLTGTVAYQTKVYGQYGPFAGGAVLVLPNGTIIPYGVCDRIPAGIYLSNFYAPKQLYNISN